jgi:hypothetical protein
MADPRFTKSKEDRSCGPLGRFIRSEKGEFVSLKPYVKFQFKIDRKIVLHARKRFQVTREEILKFFELE